MIGETILHYKIMKKLGEGGMGVVYLAEDTKLKRQVAIKFLPRHISVNEEERKRFEIEAQASASLNHPNIATIYSIEEYDNQMFIVMEYIEGRSLEDIVKLHHNASLPLDDIVNYAIQIAEGLKTAHNKGVIHRDIKSSNILVTNDGNVKIMDFGLAKLTGQEKITKANTAVGTVAYMSPEQAQGKEVTYKTDIWSLGVVLYEMLTGQLPFKGDYEQAILYLILNENPESISTLRARVPGELEKIINKTLVKDPEKRFDSMTALLDELYALNPQFKAKKKLKTILRKPKFLIPVSILLIVLVTAVILL